MSEKYFENVCGVGDLYLEKTFMKFEDENVLFICKNEKGERYLGVCYEMRYALKWILCPIDKLTILQMLMGCIALRECFVKEADKLVHIVYTEDAGEVSKVTTLDDIDERILPDKDFYLKYDMKKDVYHINICRESFAEKDSVSAVLKLDKASSDRLTMNSSVLNVPEEKYVVQKRSTYSEVNVPVDADWLAGCA